MVFKVFFVASIATLCFLATTTSALTAIPCAKDDPTCICGDNTDLFQLEGFQPFCLVETNGICDCTIDIKDGSVNYDKVCMDHVIAQSDSAVQLLNKDHMC